MLLLLLAGLTVGENSCPSPRVATLGRAHTAVQGLDGAQHSVPSGFRRSVPGPWVPPNRSGRLGRTPRACVGRPL